MARVKLASPVTVTNPYTKKPVKLLWREVEKEEEYWIETCEFCPRCGCSCLECSENCSNANETHILYGGYKTTFYMCRQCEKRLGLRW